VEALRRLLAGDCEWWKVVIKNAFWIGVAELTVRGLKAAQIVLVVRRLGPTEYGSFAFAMSFVMIFAILFDSGLVLTVTREFARSRENEGLLGDVIAIKSTLALGGFALIYGGSFYLTQDSNIRLMVLVLGANVFLGEFLNLSYAVFRARQRMEYECFIRVAQSLVMLAAVLWVLWRAPSALGVCFAYLASATLLLMALWVPLQRLGRPIRLAFRWQTWKRLMRVALPLALAGGVASLYMNIDSVMLGWWSGMEVVGWYDAADRLTAYAVLPMSIFSLVLLPAFASSSARLDHSFVRRWDLWSASMVALAAFTTCVMVAGADQLVEIAFGVPFRPAAAAVRIMSLSALLMYLYTPSYQALILFDRQRDLFAILALAVVVNGVLNAIVIPRCGLYGAAWVTVATHFFILCGLLSATARATPIKPINTVVASAFAGCSLSSAVAFLIIKLSGKAIWTSVPLGAIAYALCLLALLKVSVITGRSWISEASV
jgi:O-antigen/teichoic acid export membrane protein